MNNIAPKHLKPSFNITFEFDSDSKSYTNGDIVRGNVILMVLPEQDAKFAQLDVTLSSMALTMLEDVSSTPEFEGHGESHEFLKMVKRHERSESDTLDPGPHKFPFEFQLPRDDFNLQCLESGNFLHKKGYIKEDSVSFPCTLPPSFVYEKGMSNFAKIEYSLNVYTKKTASAKPNLEAIHGFTFLPKLNYVTFNSSKVQNVLSQTKTFEFKYRDLDSLSDAEPVQASVTMSPLLLFKKLFKKSSRASIRFDLQLKFLPHLEPYNSHFHSNNFFQDGDNLASFIEVALVTDVSFDELIKRLNPSNANTSNDALTYDSEKLVLESLRVKLITTLCYRSQIFNEKRSFKTILVNGNPNLLIDHRDFVRVENETKDDESDVIDEDTGLYKYVIPSHLFSGKISTMLPSFVTCSIKVEHRLHITAKLASFSNRKQSETVKMRSPVIVLKDFRARRHLADDNDTLPVYSAGSYDSSDEE